MSDSVFLTKESLLNTRDELGIEKVELLHSNGEVRGHVFVREMTAKEKSMYEVSLTKRLPSLGQGKNKKPEEIVQDITDLRVKLAICTLCDENGVRLFDNMLPATIKALGEQLSASNMERIADVAGRLNKMTPEEQEELTKNLEADQNDSSNSASA
jgi:hypothetical protein